MTINTLLFVVIIQSSANAQDPNQYAYEHAKYNFINKKYDKALEQIKILSSDAYNNLAYNLASIVMRSDNQDSIATLGGLYNYADGYTDELWLLPRMFYPDTNNILFGMPKFFPLTSYKLTHLDLTDINSITPHVFLSGIRKNEMLLKESYTSGLLYSQMLELADLFDNLRTKDDFQIAAARDSVINKIVKLREQYLIANLRYINTKFEIRGKCYASKSDYNFDTQIINLQLSLDDQKEGLYVATVSVPFSLVDAAKFFAIDNSNITVVNFKVSPGSERKKLGISGGGVPNWITPNLYILENPTIKFSLLNGTVYSFKTEDLQGLLWPANVDVSRWDLNKVDGPFDGYKSNTRLVKGVKLQTVEVDNKRHDVIKANSLFDVQIKY
ncbi:MAG: hypothetical protein WCJ58_08505 [bacterium]